MDSVFCRRDGKVGGADARSRAASQPVAERRRLRRAEMAQHMIRFAASRLAHFRNDGRGAVLVVTSFAMIGLLGVAAMVVDIVNIHQSEIRAQATVNAAALAAGQDIGDIPSALEAAKDYAWRNFGVTVHEWATCVDPEPLPVATDLPCVSIDDAVSPTSIRVHLPDRQVPAFFASVVGWDGFMVTASATAEVIFVTSDPAGGTPGDDDSRTPSVRDGDPGGGYDSCSPIPDWEAGLPDGSTTTTTDLSGTTTTTQAKKKDKKKGDKDGGSVKWSEFIFVFEHMDGTTSTVCGTTLATGGGNETWLAGAGGFSSITPIGMTVHVSCSANFSTGWSNKGGPEEFVDTEWRIVRYTIDKYQADSTGGVHFVKRCGDEFEVVSSTAPTGDALIRLSD